VVLLGLATRLAAPIPGLDALSLEALRDSAAGAAVGDVLRQPNSLLGHAEVQTVRTATVTESGAQGNFLTLTEG
jgi:hypothetical protein